MSSIQHVFPIQDGSCMKAIILKFIDGQRCRPTCLKDGNEIYYSPTSISHRFLVENISVLGCQEMRRLFDWQISALRFNTNTAEANFDTEVMSTNSNFKGL